MNHRISVDQITLLADIVSKHRPDLFPLLGKIGLNPLSGEEREELRGAIADELCEAGLDADDEPTRYGYQLEDLITILGHL